MLLPYLNKELIEAGCDEAGRGCLAGAVYAAAVILPKDFENDLLFQCPHAMHRAIVELNPLPDANGTGTEYNDFLFAAVMFLQKLCRFILFIEGRIKIRCFRFEFCSAGIYHFIGGKAFFRRVFSGQTHDSSVQKAHLFGFPIQFRCQLFFHQLALHFHKILQFGQEPFVNLRDIMDFRQLDAPF